MVVYWKTFFFLKLSRAMGSFPLIASRSNVPLRDGRMALGHAKCIMKRKQTGEANCIHCAILNKYRKSIPESA